LQYCLNSRELFDLNSILSSAKLCEDKAANRSSEQLCTLEYRFPYARLHFLDSEVALGEKFDACSKGVDLCGDQKDQLQSYLGNVQSTLEAKKCDFQVVTQ
jgi:hypothetical protein